ncbi:MAG: hypothetical protein ACK5HM_07120 [Gemmatimonas sp.]|uniref:hypothetical protein n=1 Tax=Gemmatimonas sp. TaxID=1962908 RepID=UPI00391CD73A
MAAEQVRDIATTRDGKVRLTLLLAPEDDATLVRDVRQAIEALEGVSDVRVDVRDPAPSDPTPARRAPATPAPNMNQPKAPAARGPCRPRREPWVDSCWELVSPAHVAPEWGRSGRDRAHPRVHRSLPRALRWPAGHHARAWHRLPGPAAA